MADKKIGIFGWIASFVIFLALLNIGTTAWFNFDILSWITFGNLIALRIIATFVSLFGLAGLIYLLSKAIGRFF